MKKEYVSPIMEITEFDTEDVITTSGDEKRAIPDYIIDGDDGNDNEII